MHANFLHLLEPVTPSFSYVYTTQLIHSQASLIRHKEPTRTDASGSQSPPPNLTLHDTPKTPSHSTHTPPPQRKPDQHRKDSPSLLPRSNKFPFPPHPPTHTHTNTNKQTTFCFRVWMHSNNSCSPKQQKPQQQHPSALDGDLSPLAAHAGSPQMKEQFFWFWLRRWEVSDDLAPAL